MKDIAVVLHGNALQENKTRLERLAGFPMDIRCLVDDVPEYEYRNALAHADVLVTAELRHDISDLSTLKLVQVPAAGYEKIDLTFLPRTTPLCRAGGHGRGIEYLLMAILAANHRLIAVDQELRRGDWRSRGAYYRPLRRELSRSTVGVLGYGEIGRDFAGKAGALFERVLALSRSALPDPHVECVYRPEDLCTFLAECDFVVVCIPYSPQTHGLIGVQELGAMRRDATLINVSRGPVVDERALYDALVADRLAGAVLDVWWNYPSSAGDVMKAANLPFDQLPQVIHTPHVSGWTEEIAERRWQGIARNIAAAVLQMGSLSHVVRRT